MLFQNLLERLAEMFPKQDYQNRLDNFIRSKNPKTTAEIEHWQKNFEQIETRKLGL